MQNNYKATNEKYGGLNPAVTNVYFTHGELDPWKPVGVLNDLAEDAPATVIPCNNFFNNNKDIALLISYFKFSVVSHVGDFGTISSNDTIGLSFSKKKVRELLIKWLNL